SAGVVVDGRPLLDRLKAVAHAALARAGAGDRLWLVLADGVARAGSREALLAAVDSARPDARCLALVDVVARAGRLVEAEPVPAREVHVVSDLQRTALEGAVSVPRGVRVLAIAPADAAPPNRGIGTLTLSDGGLAIGVTGTPGTPPAPLTVQLRGRPVARALGAPGTTVTVALPASPPGWWVGEGGAGDGGAARGTGGGSPGGCRGGRGHAPVPPRGHGQCGGAGDGKRRAVAGARRRRRVVGQPARHGVDRAPSHPGLRAVRG